MRGLIRRFAEAWNRSVGRYRSSNQKWCGGSLLLTDEPYGIVNGFVAGQRESMCRRLNFQTRPRPPTRGCQRTSQWVSLRPYESRTDTRVWWSRQPEGRGGADARAPGRRGAGADPRRGHQSGGLEDLRRRGSRVAAGGSVPRSSRGGTYREWSKRRAPASPTSRSAMRCAGWCAGTGEAAVTPSTSPRRPRIWWPGPAPWMIRRLPGCRWRP